MKSSATIILMSLLLVTAIPSITLANDIQKAAQKSVRALTATARQLVIEIPRPTEEVAGEPAFENFVSKRRLVINSMRKVLINKGVPTKRQLKKLRRWLTKLHAIGAQAGMYRLGTVEDAVYSGSIATAQSCLDTALQMVQDAH